MSVLATTNPNLRDLANMTAPNGQIDSVIELLNQVSDILDDMSWQEGNLPTGNRTTVRTGIPAPTWRKLYGGVQPNKSTYRQVTDSCGMLEAYGEVDVALMNMANDPGAFRLNEDKGHIEGFAQTVATALFFANEATAPETFTGLAPRYNSLSAANAENIIDAGGSGTDNTSMWLVGWGPNSVHGIVPKNSKAGLQVEDKGQVTIENADGSGGRMEAYRTHYRWDVGLTARDWRYIVRIANIDKSDLTKDAATGADLTDLMIRAEELIPNLNAVRPVWYTSRNIGTYLRRQAVNKTKNSTLSVETLMGRRMTMSNGIPIRRVDALAADESRVT